MTASRRWLTLWLLPLLWLLPVPGWAQLSMTLGATGDYQYNSNLFALQSGFSEPGVPASAPHGDSIYDANAAYNLKYQWSQQTAFADLAGGEYRYDYYSVLNHSEYHLDAGWNGSFLRDFDGNFEVIRSRSIVPFLYEVGVGSTLLITTEQREQGALGWQIRRRWRVEGSVYDRTVTWPQPGDPGLKLHETQGEIELHYLGTARLNSAAKFWYVTGHYDDPLASTLGADRNPPYRQLTEALTTDYMGSRSSLMMQLGYTTRSAPGALSGVNDASGVTGSLAYSNQLTAKTSVTATLARQITVYLTDSGAEVDDVASLNALWQATYKTGVTLGYSYTYSTYPGLGSAGGSRVDHLQAVQLRATYQALRWFAVKPFFSYQMRSSDLIGANFDGTTVGVDVTAQWQEP